MKKFLFIPFLFCALSATARHREHAKYKIPIKPCNNELTVAIPSITGVDKIGGVGIGLDYVRYLGKDGLFSLNLCARAVHLQNYLFLGGSDSEEYTDGGAWFFMPGIQCHPFGNKRKVNYAVGLGLPLGNVNLAYHKGVNGSLRTTKESDGIEGIAITNDVSFINQHHQHFVFGVHVAVGYTIDNARTIPFMQFGIKLGGRF